MNFFDLLFQFDAPIERAMQHLAGRSAAFDHVVQLVESLNLLKGLPFCAFFWALWLCPSTADAPLRRMETRQFVLRAIAGGLAAVAAGRLAQKLLPIRLRPMHDAALGLVFPINGSPDDLLAGWSSFPSDHAVIIASFVTAIWFRSRWLGAASALWAVFVILLPRIYLGYHYPSDIIAGALTGVAIMSAALCVPLPRPLLAWPVAFAERNAALAYGLAFLGLEQLGTNFDDLRALGSGLAKIVMHKF
jgi:membrane-associated phospholipid phosphatase